LEWPWHGLPQQVFVDNAGEWYGKSVEHVRLQVGLDIEFQPVDKPEYKGRIERWFQTFETGCFAWMPGKTFSNVVQKGDYDAESMAVVDIEELRRLVTSWIILEYNHGYHDNLKDYPSRVWLEGAKELDPTLPGKRSDLDVLDHVVKERQVNAKGLRFRNIYYHSDYLQALLYREGTRSVRFLVNPDDISEVRVQDPTTGEYFAVYPEPAFRAYTEGLSLVEHHAVLAYQRDRAHEYGRSLGLEESRAKLRREMQSLCKRAGTGLRAKTKAARILGPESAEQGSIRNVLQATEGGSSIAKEFDAEDRKAPSSKKSKKSRSEKPDEDQRDLTPDAENGPSYGNERPDQSEDDDYESFKKSKMPKNPRSLDGGQT
jgi:putative transposase